MKSDRLYHFAYVFLTLLLLASSGYPQGFLTVNGEKIVDGNGTEVHFRGMGIGGWLEPEGYMFLMSSFANSPTEIHDAIQNLIGVDSTNKFYDTFRKDFVTEADIKALHDWGFNLVRLPFHYNVLTPPDSPGVYIESGFALLDSVIAWCGKYDIYVILDMHCAPGSQNSDNIGDYDPLVASLWTDTTNQTRTVEIWQEIARRYANNSTVAGYDLLNEPHWDLGSFNAALRDLYIRITTAIRSVDTNHIIFIEGNNFATDFNGLTPPWDPKMVYSFHKYWNTNDASSIQTYLNLRTNFNVPLWLGESGENSNAWYTDCISLMNQYDIGWSWWTLKKFSTITAPLNVPITSAYQQLLNYWEGKGSKPSVAFATSALLGMAEKLKFQYCVPFKDVIDAMMRQPTDNTTKPFVPDTIPGTIYAPNYDLGRIGYAYNDVDYQNVGGSSTTWNLGWTYRNDGVDIEQCTDSQSNGYDVGWIENGEWLQYTFVIADSGSYDMNLRYASNQSGGMILLKLDGNPLTQTVVEVPVTGGWQTWGTLTVPGLRLPAGTHALMLQFIQGGFNLNSFSFVSVPTGVKTRGEQPLSFRLDQNAPNPFNPATVISYQLSTLGNVSLKVYDVLGREVATLVNEMKKPGRYEVRFDGSRLPSGLYFYRLEENGMVQVKKMLMLK